MSSFSPEPFLEHDPYARLAALLDGLPEARRSAGLAALHDAREAARRTEDELHEIAFVASHDLTDPLRMVVGYLQLLQRRAGAAIDDRAREFLFYAMDGAERMGVLLDDLMRYSRAGNAVAEATVVDVDALLVEVLRDLEPAIAETEAVVKVEGPLPALLGDRVQLGQLLQNLISNAVKFRHPDRPSTVVVRARPAAGGEGCELTVSDDGIGVGSADVERIWGAFQRGRAPREYAGNGIGLAICRRIAERHGARIWVTRAPGGGSVFHVGFPPAAIRLSAAA